MGRVKSIAHLIMWVWIACTSIASADTGSSGSGTNVIPIPGGDQEFTQPTPIETIVVDKNGNVIEKQYTYDPNQGGVVINNNEEIGGDDASLFFPMFEMGFIWASGYWVGHDGNYWNGHEYVNINNNHWDDHWNNYWHNNWNNKWNNHWNKNHNDPNWRYRNNPQWRDQSGREWRSGHEGGGFHGGGGHR